MFSGTLEAIGRVILFELSSYFLHFFNEFKKFPVVEQFDNDWYEFVEYGTVHQSTILLQRLGCTRESATYIRAKAPNAVIISESTACLNPVLLERSNINVRKEANEIRYNVPEALSLPENIHNLRACCLLTEDGPQAVSKKSSIARSSSAAFNSVNSPPYPGAPYRSVNSAVWKFAHKVQGEDAHHGYG